MLSNCLINLYAIFHPFQEEEKTKASFTHDFWFKSGDLGTMDEDGFFKITGRIKELIITEGGKNIAPIPIESRIKENLSSIVSQAIVIGDKQKYLSCLITLKVDVDPKTSVPSDQLDPSAKEWCNHILKENIGSDSLKLPNTISDFVDGEHASFLMKGIQEGIDKANLQADFRAAEVKKFCILPNEFSIPGGEFGPTLKIKRHAITKKYQDEINNMYKK